MNDEQALTYVKAAAVALAQPLDDAQARRVAANLVRTAGLAQLLEGAELSPHDELVALYCPAPFPAVPDEDRL